MNAGYFTNSSRITVPNYPHASIIQTFENIILQPASPSKTKIFKPTGTIPHPDVQIKDKYYIYKDK
jgi:hypothetical protein